VIRSVARSRRWQIIDDSASREEWVWKPGWDLDSMTNDMLEKLRARFGTE